VWTKRKVCGCVGGTRGGEQNETAREKERERVRGEKERGGARAIGNDRRTR